MLSGRSVYDIVRLFCIFHMLTGLGDFCITIQETRGFREFMGLDRVVLDLRTADCDEGFCLYYAPLRPPLLS
jgi:hypothetical protein